MIINIQVGTAVQFYSPVGVYYPALVLHTYWDKPDVADLWVFGMNPYKALLVERGDYQPGTWRHIPTEEAPSV